MGFNSLSVLTIAISSITGNAALTWQTVPSPPTPPPLPSHGEVATPPLPPVLIKVPG